MKTKEFIEKVNKLGYKAKQSQMGTSVYNEMSCYTMAMVSEDSENRVNIFYASDGLFDLIVAYAKTPVEERKPAKKHYIHVFEGNKGYLNIDDGKVRFDNKNEEHGFKTKFTDKEIEQLKQRDDIPLDWNKVKLEGLE